MGFEMSTPDYAFLKRIGGIINSGESRTLFVHGQIHDLFFAPEVGDDGSYVPLVDFLLAKWGVLRSKLLVVYELNGPIRFLHPEDKTKMSEAWLKWRSGVGANDLAIKKMLATTSARVDFEALGQNFDTTLAKAHDRPSVALEILRQMCVFAHTPGYETPFERGFGDHRGGGGYAFTPGGDCPFIRCRPPQSGHLQRLVFRSWFHGWR